MATLDDEIKSRLEKKDPLEKLIEINEKRQKVDGKISKAFGSFVRFVPILIINLAGLFIVGADNFLTGTWNWDIFLLASFWYSYLSFQTANWLIAITWFVNLINKIKKFDKSYNENLKEIQKLVDEDHDHEFIERQANIEALKRKKETLERYVYHKMFKIKTRNKIEDLDVFLKEDRKTMRGIWKKWAHARLTHLNEMLSFDWQKKYLKSYPIAYTRVTRKQIVSGVGVSRKDGEYNDYKTNIVSVSIAKIVPNAIIISILVFVLLAFQFIPKDADLSTWLKFVFQVMAIIWNTMMILSITYTIFESTFLNATEQRRSDGGLFKKRHLNNNEGEKQIVEILDSDKKK